MNQTRPIKSISAQTIQDWLLVGWRRAFTIPNYTPINWCECDIFQMKNGQFVEYEIKVNRSDFFADAKKVRHAHASNRAHSENKHALLSQGCEDGPAYFYFVIPAGLVSLEEIPDWAGLISYPYDKNGAYMSKKAPRLHKVKFSKPRRKHAVGACYYRFHEKFDQLRNVLKKEKERSTP